MQERNPHQDAKVLQKAKRKVSEEVRTVPLSLTGNIPSRESPFPTRWSSIADLDVVDFDGEKSAVVPLI